MTDTVAPIKPLGMKAYGHIPHLPGSRMGPGDHHCHEGQARILTERTRDRHDVVVVQEKLDGSCVAVAKIGGEIVPLIRAGYPAASSRWEQHHLFHDWAMFMRRHFDVLLDEGERVVGEWLAMAHGTRYDLGDSRPFVAFDIMRGQRRVTAAEVAERVWLAELDCVQTIHTGGAYPVADALRALSFGGHHGALDPVEGAVWRLERKGEVVMLAKYVRPDKVDGFYFARETWNWKP